MGDPISLGGFYIVSNLMVINADPIEESGREARSYLRAYSTLLIIWIPDDWVRYL
jgi:hypothetical protein